MDEAEVQKISKIQFFDIIVNTNELIQAQSLIISYAIVHFRIFTIPNLAHLIV
jgi:hypothetical protein